MKVLHNLKERLTQRLKQEQNASSDSSKSCILFHAINGIGLGHVVPSAIALDIRERNPSMALLFVGEGGSQALREAAKLVSHLSVEIEIIMRECCCRDKPHYLPTYSSN